MKCKMLTLFTLITILFFIPFYVNAKESCTIVSGNGTDIGSEIACGAEHFYVIDSNDTSVRMLAKYNLGVGKIYNKIKVSEERFNELYNLYVCHYSNNNIYFDNSIFFEPEFENYRTASVLSLDDSDNSRWILLESDLNYAFKKVTLSEERFNELVEQYNIIRTINNYNHSVRYDYEIKNEPEFEGYDIQYVNVENRTVGLISFPEYNLKQNSNAIGAHGDFSGQPEYPEVGVILNQEDMGSHSGFSEEYSGGYNDFIIDQNSFDEDYYYQRYLNNYRNALSNYEIEEYSYLSIDDLDNIVYKLTNNHLPLEDWLTG